MFCISWCIKVFDSYFDNCKCSLGTNSSWTFLLLTEHRKSTHKLLGNKVEYSLLVYVYYTSLVSFHLRTHSPVVFPLCLGHGCGGCGGAGVSVPLAAALPAPWWPAHTQQHKMPGLVQHTCHCSLYCISVTKEDFLSLVLQWQ